MANEQNLRKGNPSKPFTSENAREYQRRAIESRARNKAERERKQTELRSAKGYLTALLDQTVDSKKIKDGMKAYGLADDQVTFRNVLAVKLIDMAGKGNMNAMRLIFEMEKDEADKQKQRAIEKEIERVLKGEDYNADI